MSYLQLHLSTGVPSPSKTSRPTPAPPLKSVPGLMDRAPEGSAIGELRAPAVAKRRGIDNNFIMFSAIGEEEDVLGRADIADMTLSIVLMM